MHIIRPSAFADASSFPTPLADLVVRVAVANLVSAARKISLRDAAARHYPGDRLTSAAAGFLDIDNVLARAVSDPAQTTVPTWAAELAGGVGSGGVIAALTDGQSVYAQLAARGPRVSLAGKGSAVLPRRDPTPSIGGAFVGPGEAIKVSRANFAGLPIRPKMAGVISFFSRQLSEKSTPAIESVLRSAMAEDTTIEIDSVLLDANPATSIRPAGLLDGVAATAASTETGLAGLVADIRALLAAITTGPLIDPIFLASTETALVMGLLAPGVALPVIASPSVPGDRLILVDAADFASAEGDLPGISVSTESTIHAEDTNPLPLVDAAGVVASPQVSLWQSDLIGLRLLLDVSWIMARPGRVAVVDGIGW
ncbi:hypothetical protein [Mesorhizobium sp. M00.F.Ca.ET.216.01.1.1]|uniref:hypothetical protein n=1 Tax=Mesorhizobium sp. M00.F.Ca.ET.216.01.1.1 TaxID=2500528 RepID=UPI000FDB8F0D|nr:hypothetical protein [Mesorhizobium sp. M00.F.Ca.ET.216.01.1.1]TGQ41177.1 hypothetical protein EN859_012555 [Mesorhizobium sp. M00.F.Ca.ET.216.01.1.1]